MIKINQLKFATEIRFSRVLNIDFDNAVKLALELAKIKAPYSFKEDTEMESIFLIHNRIYKQQKNYLLGKLCFVANIAHDIEKSPAVKKITQDKKETKAGKKIIGFKGNLIAGETLIWQYARN